MLAVMRETGDFWPEKDTGILEIITVLQLHLQLSMILHQIFIRYHDTFFLNTANIATLWKVSYIKPLFQVS